MVTVHQYSFDMNTLQDIVNEISKVRPVDKATKHSYINSYVKLFESRRGVPTTIVEAGVASGESIKLWSMYFTHPSSRIIGLDFNTSDVIHQYDDRVSLFDGNVIDVTFVSNAIKDGVDIFIDDASHRCQDMITTFTIVKQFMLPRGVYVIEDVPDANVVKMLTTMCTKDHLEFEVIDLRHVKGRYDDVLFVIKF